MTQSNVTIAQNPPPNLRLLLGGVIVLAIILRVLVAMALGNEAIPVSGAWDQYSYDVLAQRVVQGHGFSFPSNWYPFTAADEPTAHWSYIYTLYLAGIYTALGHHPLAARLVQAILAGLGCGLAYRIGTKLFNEWAGLGAALLTAFYGYLVFFATVLMTQAFYIMALLAAIDLALDLMRNPTRRDWILLGLVLGVGVLLRQTLLLFIPILFLWLLWAGKRRIRWRDLLRPLLVVAILILPWTVYNYLTFHDFLLLNSNGGFWLYSSNHPNQGTSFDSTYVAPLPAYVEGLSEPAIDRALYREGLGFIVADPGRLLRLTLSRVGDYFWLLPSEKSSLISNLGRELSFPLYLPLIIFGLVVSRRYWRACMPLYLYLLFDTVLHLLTWAAPRYRLPSDAIMIVFAGLALVSLLQYLGSRTGILKNRLSQVDTSI